MDLMWQRMESFRKNEGMCRLETTSRLAQWRINKHYTQIASCEELLSPSFKMGLWNWKLMVAVNVKRVLWIKLFPENSSIRRENPPIVSLNMKLITYNDGHRIVYVHPEVKDKILSEGLSWNVDAPPSSETFIIDIEFLDMKTICSKKGERYSIWGYNYYNFLHKESNATLVRMLKENIYTDITINVSNESIKAHRAVLASRSPVFSNIFSNDLKENRLSTIDISDMTFEVCQVFINYIYGNINIQKFHMHRIDLLHAADKYDISDLKEACHESLVQDIDCSNVLQRLQIASMYRLEKLEMDCIQHLVRFEKLHDIKDDFMVFLEGANGDLKSKIFHEILSSWRRF